MSLLQALSEIRQIIITNSLEPQEATSQVLKYIESCEQENTITQFPYGKYRGKCLKDVLIFDRVWFERKLRSPSTYPDLKYAMQKVLDTLL